MILDDLVRATTERVRREKEELPQVMLERRLPSEPTLPFAARLRHPERLGLIAEIKRASPSKGDIAPDADPAVVAAQYREAPADCLSVLTEPDYFKGQLQDLRTAREVSGKPCLRKDFIVDQYQIVQARLWGADCILLIAAILKDWEIRAFRHAARQHGMDALVEIHDEEEARRAVANGCQFVGINNRDLSNFEVDLATTERLRPLLSSNSVVVAESGIHGPEDARRLRAAGADAILVGESLMRSGDPGSAIRNLLS